MVFVGQEFSKDSAGSSSLGSLVQLQSDVSWSCSHLRACLGLTPLPKWLHHMVITLVLEVGGNLRLSPLEYIHGVLE